MPLSRYIELLNALADESRLRLCALLLERELRVTDLVRVTGMPQSRVSTHLGRLREVGFVRDRRDGAQSFYALAVDGMPAAVKAVLDAAAESSDPTLLADQKRLLELESERRGERSESVTDEFERYYSPGRTWQSLTSAIAGLLKLGDVLDVGTGDGAAAAYVAPYCRSMCCIEVSPKRAQAAAQRLARFPHVRVEVADVLQLPFAAASFDSILLFHTLTYAEDPARALRECARVLRPGGRLSLLCLAEHTHLEMTARYGERHPGFSPAAVRELLGGAGLGVACAEVVSRENRKPHFEVVLAIGDKNQP